MYCTVYHISEIVSQITMFITLGKKKQWCISSHKIGILWQLWTLGKVYMYPYSTFRSNALFNLCSSHWIKFSTQWNHSVLANVTSSDTVAASLLCVPLCPSISLSVCLSVSLTLCFLKCQHLQIDPNFPTLPSFPYILITIDQTFSMTLFLNLSQKCPFNSK